MKLGDAIIIYACFQTAILVMADDLPAHRVQESVNPAKSHDLQIPNVVSACRDQSWPDLSADCLQISAATLGVHVRIVGM